MKSKKNTVSFLFLILVATLFIGCTHDQINEEIYDTNQITMEKNSSAKSAQSSTGGGGGIDPDDDNL